MMQAEAQSEGRCQDHHKQQKPPSRSPKKSKLSVSGSVGFTDAKRRQCKGAGARNAAGRGEWAQASITLLNHDGATSPPSLQMENTEPRGVRDGVGAANRIQLVEELADMELGRVHRD